MPAIDLASADDGPAILEMTSAEGTYDRYRIILHPAARGNTSFDRAPAECQLQLGRRGEVARRLAAQPRWPQSAPGPQLHIRCLSLRFAVS
jgi:hypothetical protein